MKWLAGVTDTHNGRSCFSPPDLILGSPKVDRHRWGLFLFAEWFFHSLDERLSEGMTRKGHFNGKVEVRVWYEFSGFISLCQYFLIEERPRGPAVCLKSFPDFKGNVCFPFQGYAQEPIQQISRGRPEQQRSRTEDNARAGWKACHEEWRAFSKQYLRWQRSVVWHLG